MSDTDNGGVQPDQTSPREDDGQDRPQGGTPDGGAAEHNEQPGADLSTDPGAPTQQSGEGLPAPDGGTADVDVDVDVNGGGAETTPDGGGSPEGD
jgi:hypothetical protein